MAISLDVLSDSDLKRFALCWLSCDRTTVNWEAAAAAYDPNVKWESFRTVTSKATNKALKGTDGDGEGPAPKAKKAAAGKRKKNTSEAGAEDEDAPKPKKGKAGRAKKAKSEEKAPSDVEDNGEGDKSD